VFSRYVLGTTRTHWALDVQIMLYGTLFMMAGAYTLSKNGHVRGDVLYGFFSPAPRPRWT
jgi:TRAP-type mannitol/chloroaromatic compound transport system permease small subunit